MTKSLSKNSRVNTLRNNDTSRIIPYPDNESSNGGGLLTGDDQSRPTSKGNPNKYSESQLILSGRDSFNKDHQHSSEISLIPKTAQQRQRLRGEADDRSDNSFSSPMMKSNGFPQKKMGTLTNEPTQRSTMTSKQKPRQSHLIPKKPLTNSSN